MNKKTVTTLAVLNTLLLAMLGVRVVLDKRMSETKVERALDSYDAQYEQAGAFVRGEYARLVHLMGTTHDSETISDDDLAWTLDLMRRTQAKSDNRTAQFASGWIPVVWINVVHPTASQGILIRDAALDLLKHSELTADSPDVSSALLLVGRFKDVRALPLVRRLLVDSDENTRAWAVRTIKALGEQIPAKAEF